MMNFFVLGSIVSIALFLSDSSLYSSELLELSPERPCISNDTGAHYIAPPRADERGLERISYEHYPYQSCFSVLADDDRKFSLWKNSDDEVIVYDPRTDQEVLIWTKVQFDGESSPLWINQQTGEVWTDRLNIHEYEKFLGKKYIGWGNEERIKQYEARHSTPLPARFSHEEIKTLLSVYENGEFGPGEFELPSATELSVPHAQGLYAIAPGFTNWDDDIHLRTPVFFGRINPHWIRVETQRGIFSPSSMSILEGVSFILPKLNYLRLKGSGHLSAR